MKISLEHGTAFTLARVSLAAGESIRAESGAMVSMTGGVAIATKMQGGLLASLARKVLTSESFFQNMFTAERGPGEVTFAPSLPGDIRLAEMNGSPLILQSGAYLASDTNVTIETSWGGAKGFFGREGLILLRATGRGPLLFASYGAIVEVDVPAEGYVIDTGHVVAFEPTLQWEVSRVGGLKSTLFSGEGLVSRFAGRGKVWLQTRSFDAFIGTITPYISRSSQ